MAASARPGPGAPVETTRVCSVPRRREPAIPHQGVDFGVPSAESPVGIRRIHGVSDRVNMLDQVRISRPTGLQGQP